MRGFNTDEGLVQFTQDLYGNLSVQFFSTDSMGSSSGHQWASVRDVYSLASCSTLFLRR
ncbi:hypothetical protein DPMN_064000 [Dreissena polymorpha]|uniref:Uncharacterized protein n=1 Tax=Dreissena polymorpha TaxID=45954 RepID=A0A9D4HJ38_DREPO|nr:hypothetical protein DPMN_064000 [Dreissena polymorpha]